MAEKVREGHVPLSGWTWVALGLVVAAYAKFVEVKNPDYNAMTLFFYVGLVMAAVGAAKLLLKKTAKTETKATQKESQQYAKQLDQQRKQWQQQVRQQQQHPAQHSIIKCPQCGAQHYATSQYCHRCGSRLR